MTDENLWGFEDILAVHFKFSVISLSGFVCGHCVVVSVDVHLSGSVQTEMHIIFHIFPPEHSLLHTSVNNSEGFIALHSHYCTKD